MKKLAKIVIWVCISVAGAVSLGAIAFERREPLEQTSRHCALELPPNGDRPIPGMSTEPNGTEERILIDGVRRLPDE